jgi:energy-coupling factor transport system permease protein
VSYQRRSSPLHAARAAAGLAYCLALGCAALLLSAPVALGAVTLATVSAGHLAGVGRQLRRAALFALPLGLLVAAINALVARDGLTVIWRLGQVPLLGHVDVTLEATAYGAILGLRAVTLVLCASLYTAAVDPDEVLKAFRPISFRSALTATLATRMVPILIRDSRRLVDARRCRPGPAPSRLTLLRATTSGVLDRALDVAATLEVRGYGAARRPARHRMPYSRHDVAFLASAVAILGLAIAEPASGLAPFAAYPALRVPVAWPELIVSLALVVSALLPFLDRRGIAR